MNDVTDRWPPQKNGAASFTRVLGSGLLTSGQDNSIQYPESKPCENKETEGSDQSTSRLAEVAD